MKDWKNIMIETKRRFIGTESSNIVGQYSRVNLWVSKMTPPPSPCYLENGSMLYIHATWQTHTFHYEYFFRKKNLGGVAMTLMLSQ